MLQLYMLYIVYPSLCSTHAIYRIENGYLYSYFKIKLTKAEWYSAYLYVYQLPIQNEYICAVHIQNPQKVFLVIQTHNRIFKVVNIRAIYLDINFFDSLLKQTDFQIHFSQ